MNEAAAHKTSTTPDASTRDWNGLSAEAPQLAATMRRYLIQLGTFLAPGSVDMASHTLRQFAGWLVASTDVRVVADIRRAHIEDYKVWLAVTIQVGPPHRLASV